MMDLGHDKTHTKQQKSFISQYSMQSQRKILQGSQFNSVFIVCDDLVYFSRRENRNHERTQQTILPLSHRSYQKMQRAKLFY